MKRLIPCLTIHRNKLVKTINFDIKNSNYIGDPLNTVKILNEKEAEEIIIIDIGATIENSNLNFELIKKISSISRMPVCYSGGIKSVSQVDRIFSYGIEKISISSIIFEDFDFLEQLVKSFGRQSISVTIDIKKIQNEYFIFTHNAKVLQKIKLMNLIEKIKDLAGEIIINNIDHDGRMNGIDLEIIKKIYNEVDIPIVALGGFGDINQLKDFFEIFQDIGAACGSLFIYKGKNKAVLINYPIDKIKNS